MQRQRRMIFLKAVMKVSSLANLAFDLVAIAAFSLSSQGKRRKSGWRFQAWPAPGPERERERESSGKRSCMLSDGERVLSGFCAPARECSVGSIFHGSTSRRKDG